MGSRSKMPKRERYGVDSLSLEHLTTYHRAWLLTNKVMQLPAHRDGEDVGWWCGEPALMKMLLDYVVDEPEGPDQEERLAAFRTSVARQLGTCRACVYEYHCAIAEWHRNLESNTGKNAAKRLRARTTLDGKRLAAALVATPERAQMDETSWRCTGNALLECFMDHRLWKWTDSLRKSSKEYRPDVLSDALARVIESCKRRKNLSSSSNIASCALPLRTKDAVEFFTRNDAVPDGWMWLYFHPNVLIREWSQRVCNQLAQFHPETASMIEKVLRMRVRDIERASGVRGRTPDSEIGAADALATWHGMESAFRSWDTEDLESFADTLGCGRLFLIVCNSLLDRQDAILRPAGECVKALVKALPFEAMYTPDLMSPEKLLEILFQSLSKTNRSRNAKENLLHLIAPILYSVKQHSATKTLRLYRKCFDFFDEVSSQTFFAHNVFVCDEGRNDNKLRSSIMRTFASLLNWNYALAAPNLPINDVKKISQAVNRVLVACSTDDWGWHLLRTVLVTDVLNMVHYLRPERDAKMIAKTFLVKRVGDGVLSDSEKVLIDVVNACRESNVLTWVGPLWESAREGKLFGEVCSDIPPQGLAIFLDLHRLIGMIGLGRAGGAPLGPVAGHLQSGSDAKTTTARNETYIRACLLAIQETVSAGLSSTFSTSNRVRWYKDLPFHAADLLASANKDVSKSAFEALEKLTCLNGAIVYGSRSKLVAEFLKRGGNVEKSLVDGCISTMRIISAYGPAIATSTYVKFLLWYRILLESGFTMLTKTENVSWALGVILSFLEQWRALEERTKKSVFREVCCRFLSNLRIVLRLLVGSRPAHRNSELKDTYSGMFDTIMTSLMGMGDLKDSTCRSCWIFSIAQLSPYWAHVAEFRENMVLFIESQESLRDGRFSVEDCQMLISKANLKKLDVVMNRWHRAEYLTRCGKGIKGQRAKPSELCGRGHPDIGSNRLPLVEKKSSAASRYPVSGYNRGGIAKHRALFLGPPSRDRMLVDFGKSHSEHVKSKILSRRRPMKSLVSEDELLAMDPMKANKEKKGLTSKQSSGESQDDYCGQSDENESDSLEQAFAVPGYRRFLERRVIERIHRDLLSTPVSEVHRTRPQRLNAGRLLRKEFEDVEDYVKYWESIVLSEFVAAVQANAEEESQFADRLESDAGSKSCRHLFVVASPVESRGYIQHLTVRFCDENGRTRVADGIEGQKESSFNIFQSQVSDIVVMHIIPVAGIGESRRYGAAASSLAMVDKVERERGEYSLRLSVSFPHCESAPGNGRLVRMSRLSNSATFHRQIDALWGLPGVANGVLWPILSPREGLLVNAEFKSRLSTMIEDDSESPVHFARELLSKGVLNESQTAAIVEVLRACAPSITPSHKLPPSVQGITHGSLTMIQGPPGTGKTATVIAMLSAILLAVGTSEPFRKSEIQHEDGWAGALSSPVRVLVCAPSNAAVDELMVRIMEDGLQTPSGFKVSPRMLRVGRGTTVESIRPLELRSMVDQTASRSDLETANALGSKLNDMLAEMAELNTKLSAADDELRAHHATIGKAEAGKKSYDKDSRAKALVLRQLRSNLSTLHEKKRELGAALSKVREERKETEKSRKQEHLAAISSVINGASIVFATLSSSGSELLKKHGVRFDVVIVDEAAQCGEPELLIPIAQSQKYYGQTSSPPHVVLVGDPKQLPATVISRDRLVSKALGQSLFERIGDHPQSTVHVLNTQYRMHPVISLFPNGHFYGGRLRNGPNVLRDHMHRTFHLDPKTRFGPLTFLDLSHVQCREVRTAVGSLCNIREAEVIISAVTALIKGWEKEDFNKSIVILSPYRGQVALLKRRLRRESTIVQNAGVEVSTIDGIQGREKSIVFLSTVRSDDTRGIGFVDDDRRMNVAITRAKHSLIVVGNASVLSKHSRLWSAFVTHCRSSSTLLQLPADPLSFFPECRTTKAQAAVRQRNEEKTALKRTAPSSKKGEPTVNRKRLHQESKPVPKGIPLRSALSKGSTTAPVLNLQGQASINQRQVEHDERPQVLPKRVDAKEEQRIEIVSGASGKVTSRAKHLRTAPAKLKSTSKPKPCNPAAEQTRSKRLRSGAPGEDARTIGSECGEETGARPIKPMKAMEAHSSRLTRMGNDAVKGSAGPRQGNFEKPVKSERTMELHSSSGLRKRNSARKVDFEAQASNALRPIKPEREMESYIANSSRAVNYSNRAPIGAEEAAPRRLGRSPRDMFDKSAGPRQDRGHLKAQRSSGNQVSGDLRALLSRPGPSMHAQSPMRGHPAQRKTIPRLPDRFADDGRRAPEARDMAEHERKRRGPVLEGEHATKRQKRKGYNAGKAAWKRPARDPRYRK